MLLKFILSLFILAALPGGSGEVTNPDYYEDYEDTTSKWDAWELTHDGLRTLSCAEVYGVNDTYDYVTYTSPHSYKTSTAVHFPPNSRLAAAVYLLSCFFPLAIARGLLGLSSYIILLSISIPSTLHL